MDAFGELGKDLGIEVTVKKNDDKDQFLDYPFAPIVGETCSSVNELVFTSKVYESILRGGYGLVWGLG